MTKTITKALVIAGFIAGFTARASANTIWYVDATFAYNSLSNTEMGTFQLDPSLNLVTWDITVSGSNTAADLEYTPSNSNDVFPDLTRLDFFEKGGTGPYADLYFASPLSNAGGAINLLYGNGGANSFSTIVCAGCGTLVTGSVSTTATPEPPAIGILSGLGILGLVVLRRRGAIAS
jgi:hypothetical protein